MFIITVVVQLQKVKCKTLHRKHFVLCVCSMQHCTARFIIVLGKLCAINHHARVTYTYSGLHTNILHSITLYQWVLGECLISISVPDPTHQNCAPGDQPQPNRSHIIWIIIICAQDIHRKLFDLNKCPIITVAIITRACLFNSRAPNALFTHLNLQNDNTSNR